MENSGKKRVLILLIAVALIIIVGVTVFISNRNAHAPAKQTETKLPESVIVFPTIKTTSPMNAAPSDLVQQLKLFTTDESEKFSIDNVTYTTGNPQDIGYQISYQLSGGKLQEVFRTKINLVLSQGWRLLAKKDNLSPLSADFEKTSSGDYKGTKFNVKYQTRYTVGDKGDHLEVSVHFIILH